MNSNTRINTETDRQAIDNLTCRFFDVFTNKDSKSPKIDDLKNIFIKEGIIVNNTGNQTLIYNLDEFIVPREKMLTDGSLINFIEYEVSNETDVFENIAQRFCVYRKSGELNGKQFESEGMKTIQFIKVGGDWKITSVVWCDKQ